MQPARAAGVARVRPPARPVPSLSLLSPVYAAICADGAERCAALITQHARARAHTHTAHTSPRSPRLRHRRPQVHAHPIHQPAADASRRPSKSKLRRTNGCGKRYRLSASNRRRTRRPLNDRSRRQTASTCIGASSGRGQVQVGSGDGMKKKNRGRKEGGVKKEARRPAAGGGRTDGDF